MSVEAAAATEDKTAAAGAAGGTDEQDKSIIEQGAVNKGNGGQQGGDDKTTAAGKDEATDEGSNLLEAGDPANLGVPDKFIVKGEDGKIDITATLKKLGPSYRKLEERIGDVPPENEDGYKIEYKFPEGMALSTEREKAFRQRAHARGISNKNLQWAMDEYATALGEGLQIQRQQAAQILTDSHKEVNEEWGEAAEANAKLAIVGYNAVANEEERANTKPIGRDLKATYKMLMKALAKVGSSFQEDTPPAGEGEGSEDIETLKKSDAYFKKDHPDHVATVQKVRQYYERKYPGQSMNKNVSAPKK